MSFLAKFKAANAVATDPNRWGSPVQATPEFDRIDALPRRVRELDATPDLTPLFRRPGGTLRLRPLQSLALEEAAMVGGLFGMLPVGSGKTLTALLLPAALASSRAVYLVGAELRGQLENHDIPFYDQHFKLPLSVLTIVTYNDLSSQEMADELERLQPDLVIADEAHRLRHKSAARTRRFLRYMGAHPRTRFAALSGSFTTRSLHDYAHLIGLALGAGSPLPRDYPTLKDWAGALDPPTVAAPTPPGALLRWCQPGEGPRLGYQRRLAQTPGVVAVDDDTMPDCALYLRERPLALPAGVQQALDRLNATWTTPEGEELSEAMALSKYARQLACGFYYRWAWPAGQVDQQWLDARRAWHRTVRSFLLYHSRVGLDSPGLLEAACLAGKAPTLELRAAWSDWQAVAARPAPPVEAVWLDQFMRDDVAAWVRERAGGFNGRGIVWYTHDAVGELLRPLGLPQYGAGEDASGATAPVIVCSVQSQGTGKNLQSYSRALVTSPSSNGSTWEQLLGREHRPGQQDTEVWCDIYRHTAANRAAIDRALADASYARDTQGLRQKLLVATRLF